MKNKEKVNTLFRVSVVYGFKDKLEIVLLGEINRGEMAVGMNIYIKLAHGTEVGNWTVKEILNMDFINGHEHENFIGIVVACKNESDFKLLQSLRVYDETIELRLQK